MILVYGQCRHRFGVDDVGVAMRLGLECSLGCSHKSKGRM